LRRPRGEDWRSDMDKRECKCGEVMSRVAHEKDYGDTVARVFWCPDCGRLLRVDFGPVSRQGSDSEAKETWQRPLVTEDV